jgi:hypothetical protein
MNLTVSLGRVPEGVYRCFFWGVETITHKKHGERLRFLFLIIEGPYAGEKVSQVTGAIPTPWNRAGRMLAELLQRPLQLNEDVDMDELEIQHLYRVAVEQKTDGTPHVVDVLPDEQV